MSQSLVAAVAVIGGLIAVLADGAASVSVAGLLCGLCLAPAAATVGGPAAAATLAVEGAVAAAAAAIARRVAGRLRFVPGLDPVVPVVAPREGLFGPRSSRVFGAAVSIIGASWVGLNVEVGIATRASGSVFAAAYVWLVGIIRLLRARGVDELAVGAVAVSLATACAWILEAGPHALAEAAAVGGMAPLAAACSGWLTGRHGRRSDDPSGAPT